MTPNSFKHSCHDKPDSGYKYMEHHDNVCVYQHITEYMCSYVSNIKTYTLSAQSPAQWKDVYAEAAFCVAKIVKS